MISIVVYVGCWSLIPCDLRPFSIGFHRPVSRLPLGRRRRHSSEKFLPMTERCILRPMERADLEQVLAVENQCYAFPWSAELFLRELENPLATVDLLWMGGDLAGYLCSWLVAGELQILNVATAPAFRRRGVAATLLRHALARGRQQGFQGAFLEVRASNFEAIALYGTFGFKPVSLRKGYYADGEDALLMELTTVKKGRDVTPGR